MCDKVTLITMSKPTHNKSYIYATRTAFLLYCIWHLMAYLQGHIDCRYSNVIMSEIVSQISGVSIVYSIICSGADQRKHQSSASLAFVKGIHRSTVDSSHKGPVTRTRFHLMTSSCVMKTTARTARSNLPIRYLDKWYLSKKRSYLM